MSKKPISATVDPEVEEFLSQDDVNASGLINQLVRNYMYGGEGNKMMLEFRRRQLEAEVEEMEMKKQRLEQIEQRLDGFQDEADRIVREADAALDDDVRETGNPAVRNWADKAGLKPDELLNQLEKL